MAAIFDETKIFFNWDGYPAEIPCGSKILSKLLYLARFSRSQHFCALQFLRKIRKFKMAAIFGETKIFLKIQIATLNLLTLWVKFSPKSLYLARLRRYRQFCVLLVNKIVNA